MNLNNCFCVIELVFPLPSVHYYWLVCISYCAMLHLLGIKRCIYRNYYKQHTDNLKLYIYIYPFLIIL